MCLEEENYLPIFLNTELQGMNFNNNRTKWMYWNSALVKLFITFHYAGGRGTNDNNFIHVLKGWLEATSNSLREIY